MRSATWNPSVRDMSGNPRTSSRGQVALPCPYARMGQLAEERRGAQGRPVQSRGRRSSLPSVGRSNCLREYQQTSPFLPPCTVCSYTATLVNLVDRQQLSHGAPWDALWHSWREDWRHHKFDLHVEPPTWVLGDLVLEAGHTGIIFPSIANPGGANVVIFSERLEGKNRIEVNDPKGRLPRNRSSWERSTHPADQS